MRQLRGGQSGVSEAAQAICLPRLLFEYFALGYARTHASEFLDEWPDPELDEQKKNFGIVRNDWSRKPAFHAIQRLLTLLEDPGPAFEPGALALFPVQPLGAHALELSDCAVLVDNLRTVDRELTVARNRGNGVVPAPFGFSTCRTIGSRKSSHASHLLGAEPWRKSWMMLPLCRGIVEKERNALEPDADATELDGAPIHSLEIAIARQFVRCSQKYQVD